MKKRNLFLADFLAFLAGTFLQHLALWGWIFLTKLVYVLVSILFAIVIGWLFGSTILGILSDLGLEGYSMWQIGAFLGFVGSFFGTTVNNWTPNQKREQQPQQPMHPYGR